MLALGFDFVSQNAQLFTHQLFHQIFASAGKVFLPEVDRATQHGLPDRHPGLQPAVQADVRRFTEDAGDGEFLSVYVAGRQRHLTATA